MGFHCFFPACFQCRGVFFFFCILVASQPKRLIFPPSPVPSFLPDKWLAADFPPTSSLQNTHILYIFVYFHCEFCPRSRSPWPAVHTSTSPSSCFAWTARTKEKKRKTFPSVSHQRSGNSQLARHRKPGFTRRGRGDTEDEPKRGGDALPRAPTPLHPVTPPQPSSSASPLPHPNPTDQISFHSRSGDSFSGPGLF